MPYTWYGEKAKQLLSDKNVTGSMDIKIEELPNIVYESLMILQEYDNQLKNEKINKATQGNK